MSLYIFDLDGVIYLGETLLPEVKETLIFLKKRGDELSFLTNNSTLSRDGFSSTFKEVVILSASLTNRRVLS